ncbi:MAG: hypothetical protein GX184_06850 [Clostridiaceae bacterium]|nr:hypothetical protein [Clostridiaceae bacterium]
MAKVKAPLIRFLITFIAGVITGALIGASLLCVFLSYKIDLFYEKIATLENTIRDKDAKLQNLEKAVNSKNFVLKSIETVLITEENTVDEIDKIDIEQVIKEKFLSLIGNEVRNLDADIIMMIIDNRIIRLNDKEFFLQVEKLMLSEKLKLWVKVDLID